MAKINNAPIFPTSKRGKIFIILAVLFICIVTIWFFKYVGYSFYCTDNGLVPSVDVGLIDILFTDPADIVNKTT